MQNFFRRALTAFLVVATLMFANALTCFAEDEDNPRQAIQKYTECIKRNPNDAEAYVCRAIVYNELEQYDKAVADCSKALELDSDCYFAYQIRGRSYYSLKQYKKAIVDLTKYLEFEPDDYSAYAVLALCYHEIGDNARAKAAGDKAIELAKKQGKI